ILRDSLTHLAHAGDRAMLSATLLLFADSLAPIEPSLALQFLALYESDAIAAWSGYEYQPAIAELARRNTAELDTARVTAAAMNYNDAITFILESVDQVIERVAAPSGDPAPDAAS